MLTIRLSPVAQRDIESILLWSHQHYGQSGRIRYEALLVQAIADLAEAPDRPGVFSRPELYAEALTYHLRSSRDNVPELIGRVQTPRHLLLYRLSGDGALEIARVLHDSMDLPRHLPPEDCV